MRSVPVNGCLLWVLFREGNCLGEPRRFVGVCKCLQVVGRYFTRVKNKDSFDMLLLKLRILYFYRGVGSCFFSVSLRDGGLLYTKQLEKGSA